MLIRARSMIEREGAKWAKYSFYRCPQMKNLVHDRCQQRWSSARSKHSERLFQKQYAFHLIFNNSHLLFRTEYEVGVYLIFLDKDCHLNLNIVSAT